jgi:alcohol dehydrogenase (cytochrome c)
MMLENEILAWLSRTWCLSICLLLGFAHQAGAEEFPAGHEAAPPGGLWGGFNKTYDGQRFSPLREINTENVASLKETCRVKIAQRGAFQAGPVVIDGTIFVTTSVDTVALDPTNCAVKWKHVWHPEQNERFAINRGVAYLDGRVFRGTADGRLLALDAATGKVLWTDVVGDPDVGEYVSSAPIAWNGLVFVGTSGSDWAIKGRIMAYEAASGREVWRFTTIPTGNEIGADSWKTQEWAQHGGGGTWSHFALDPLTAELFVPVGNPVPDFAPEDRPGANLFTDSVLVLDTRTGAVKWWYQLVPHDGRDLDLAAAPMLYRNDNQRSVVALAGKDGYVHVVDRETHQLLFKTAVTTIENEGKPAAPEGTRFCPGIAGGVEWNGPALDATRRSIFVGSVDWCTITKPGHSTYNAGDLAYGGNWQLTRDNPRGWVVALDADTGKVKWRYHADAPVLAGVTATAGGIVLTGDNAGNFLALDSGSGKVLKKIETGGSMSGGVVTYEQGGKQYIAFTAGNVSRTIYGAGGRPTLVILQAETLVERKTAASDTPDPEHGAEVFRQTCTGCHGSDGANIAGFNLKGLKNRMTTDQIMTWLQNPAPPMPKVFPLPLDEQDQKDLRDVTAYIQKAF